jgi:hypothetical protein
VLKVSRIRRSLKTLQNRCSFLESANEKLKVKYEDSAIENETNLKQVENLEKKAEILALK